MRVEWERRVLRLFDAMLDRPAEDREHWLEHASGGDPALTAAVRALAAADGRASALPTVLPDGAEPAEPPPPPERLGHWRLGRELGRGGMGVVYLGERADGLFEQRVAVKLARHPVGSRAALTFAAERRALAAMEHPGVARLIDGGVAPDGRPWLAAEYVEGVPLDAGAADRPLARSAELVLQAARAVAFAHGRLLAHGDIKPANILVDVGGRARLLDFGVARLLGSDGAGSGALTPDYASPERRAGAPPSVADDVYALGRTLLAAAGPAGAADRELSAIARAATAPEERRYEGAAALAADLEARAAGRPVAAMGGGPAYRLAKFAARNRAAVLAAALAVPALLGATVAAEHNAARASRARAAEQARFADAHRTAHFLMFDLLDRLERRPGTLRLRAQVGDVGQAYLDRLAAIPSAPREVRLDVARGYLRAAATTAMSNAPNLGDVGRATRDLGAAGRMLAALRREDPDWPALLGPLGRAYSLRCQNQIYGGNHDAGRALAEARAGLAVLASVGTDRAAQAAAAWQVRVCEGDALVWLEHAPDAVALLERELARGRARRPSDPVTEERNLRILGEAYYYAKRFPDAERVLKEAAATQAAAHRTQPFYGPAVNEAANVADDLASTYGEQRRWADQLRVAKGALALVEAQAALDADDGESRRRALSLSRLVAGALARTDRHGQAVALMERTNEGWAAVARRFPDDTTVARLRLLATAVTGDLRRGAGDRAGACAAYAEARRGWAVFARRWRLSAADRRENVAEVEQDLAACAGHGRFADG